VLIAAFTLLILALFGLIFDVVSNYGRIHAGVTVQGVDVGGLPRDEAAAMLTKQLTASLAATPVAVFADAQLAGEGVGPTTVDLTGPSTSYNANDGSEGNHSWQISATTIGATIDGVTLAEEAYAVGRGPDFFAGRFRARFFGVEIAGFVRYEPTQLASLESILNTSLGWPAQNADISFVDGSFVVVAGEEGYGVEHEALIVALNRAFLGTDRSLVVPMSAIPLIVGEQAANEASLRARQAIEQPVTLVYGEDSWELDANSLGPWIATSVVDGTERGAAGAVAEAGGGAAAEGAGAAAAGAAAAAGGGAAAGAGAARLVCRVDESRLTQGVHDIIGDLDVGTPPQNARFEIVEGQVNIIESTPGSGVDYRQLTADLDAVLFGGNAGAATERRVTLSVTTLEPSFTTAQAQDMRITGTIASYTTEYPVASDAKITNIHLAADLLDHSLIEPGGIWSFNDTTGECNAEGGFQEATSIVEGEYIDEIGGGICQVATTVFNAVFDSGLPIVERVNHGFYLISYPAGRDAAVSWRWPDLKFENDTDNWILLTMAYTNSTVTCTLWGTDPGYRVESEASDFFERTDFETKRVENPELAKGEERVKQEGVQGRSIIVTRYVYNSVDELLRKTDFRSIYEPEPEIIEVGTKEDEADKEDRADEADKTGQSAKQHE
jgi:vancomycin resistance protein YoaR